MISVMTKAVELSILRNKERVEVITRIYRYSNLLWISFFSLFNRTEIAFFNIRANTRIFNEIDLNS